LRISKLAVCVFSFLLSSTVNGESIVVLDDLGNEVTISQPAARIVSLAPHLTEILFSLDVGDKIVGTVKFSDFPKKAKNIPRLGDAFALNVEAIVAMQPDIIFAWHTGGVSASVERLNELGIPVFVNHSSSLNDIASGFVRMGKLVGKAANGLRLQSQFNEKLKRLESDILDGPVVFFQISDQDLYTISDNHIIGQSIRHCGGQNLFPDLQPDVTLVSKEAVIAGSPDLILLTHSTMNSPGTKASPWLNRWQSYSFFKGRVALIDPGLISRPSFRMLEGLSRICELIAPVDGYR